MSICGSGIAQCTQLQLADKAPETLQQPALHLTPVSPTLCPVHLHKTKAPAVLERKTPSCTHSVTCSWVLQPVEKDKFPRQKTKQV